MKYSYVLWDWNGTLLDDVDVSIDCVNILLEKMGLDKTDKDEYFEQMDMPMHKYYENLFLSRNQKLDYEICTENFHENYPKLAGSVGLHKNAVEMLEFFENSGVKQSIVSAFEKGMLNAQVEKLGVRRFFEAVSGNDDVYVGSKSQRAIDLVKGFEKKKVLYIGDTKADVETALDVGCDCILFSGGHYSRKALEQFNFPVIDDLIELKKYV
ncbi:MAG: HAD family hydrolase [Clostridia bacterium]|nr:HAD family hydrolase [Clostridia bacterium]